MTFEIRIPWVAVVLGALMAAAVPGYAANDKVTYYEHVAPILQANCQSCHRPAGANIGSLVAPMSLMTYTETRPWARAIARKVKAREMPPWFASEPKGVFANEKGLTEKDIETIAAWVEAGAPAGDAAKAPAPRVFVEAGSGGYSLGKPDLIFRVSKPYFVSDEAQDVQGNFDIELTEELLSQDVWIRAWEFRTGSYRAGQDTVHHMCGGVKPPGHVPAPDAEAGDGSNAQLGCVAGGAEPYELPDGFGMLLQKGATIALNMHYYKQPGPGTGYWNQAEVGFYLAKGPVKHVVTTRTLGNNSFEIPPHVQNHRIGAAMTLKKDTLLLALWPHAHLRATAARYIATYPDGRQEVLLDVPRYDQSWQVTYKYKQPKLLPKGTRIDSSMLFDNTAGRGAKRVFNPNRTIWFGPKTQDEMMVCFITYAELEPGQTTASAQQP